MIRTVPLILAVALLTGPVYAADKIALVCSGTATLEDGVPHPLASSLSATLVRASLPGLFPYLALSQSFAGPYG